MRPEVPGSGDGGPVPEGMAAPAPPRPREPLSPRGSFDAAIPVAGGATRPRPARGARRKRGGRGKRAFLSVALALGLGGFAVSGLGVATQVLPRDFTRAQRLQILNWEMSRRWREWPAGRIFPPTVGYRLAGSLFGGGPGIELSADRIGIAPGAGCAAALDGVAAKALTGRDCATVLRATYDDATKTLAVTVGVVVTPGPDPAQAGARALGSGSRSDLGVRTVAFRRTLAARFGDGQRQVAWHVSVGPYLVLATAGYADGRRHAASSDPYMQDEMLSLASGVGRAIADALGAAPPPPRCPGGPAC